MNRRSGGWGDGSVAICTCCTERWELESEFVGPVWMLGECAVSTGNPACKGRDGVPRASWPATLGCGGAWSLSEISCLRENNGIPNLRPPHDHTRVCACLLCTGGKE